MDHSIYRIVCVIIFVIEFVQEYNLMTPVMFPLIVNQEHDLSSGSDKQKQTNQEPPRKLIYYFNLKSYYIIDIYLVAPFANNPLMAYF